MMRAEEQGFERSHIDGNLRRATGVVVGSIFHRIDDLPIRLLVGLSHRLACAAAVAAARLRFRGGAFLRRLRLLVSFFPAFAAMSSNSSDPSSFLWRVISDEPHVRCAVGHIPALSAVAPKFDQRKGRPPHFANRFA
jgi:hypothetical protein